MPAPKKYQPPSFSKALLAVFKASFMPLSKRTTAPAAPHRAFPVYIPYLAVLCTGRLIHPFRHFLYMVCLLPYINQGTCLKITDSCIPFHISGTCVFRKGGLALSVLCKHCLWYNSILPWTFWFWYTFWFCPQGGGFKLETIKNPAAIPSTAGFSRFYFHKYDSCKSSCTK